MKKTFPVILGELRKEKRISQKDAAAALGVSQALLSHYENGIRECGQDFLIRAADYYKVTCDYLLGRSSAKTGFSGMFKAGQTLPEDKNLSDVTVFRASIELHEKLGQAEKYNGVDYTGYTSIALYRLILQQTAAGNLPKSWAYPGDTDFYNPLFLEIVNGSFSMLTNPVQGLKINENEPVPQCIQTLSKSAHDTIMKLLATNVPPIPDAYKK